MLVPIWANNALGMSFFGGTTEQLLKRVQEILQELSVGIVQC